MRWGSDCPCPVQFVWSLNVVSRKRKVTSPAVQDHETSKWASTWSQNHLIHQVHWSDYLACPPSLRLWLGILCCRRMGNGVWQQVFPFLMVHNYLNANKPSKTASMRPNQRQSEINVTYSVLYHMWLNESML